MGHTQKIPDSELNKIKNLYFEQGKTYQEIAILYGCGQSTITRFFARHSISPGRGGKNIVDPGKDIIGKDISNGLTNRQIAAKYKVGIQAACNWIRKHGFDIDRGVLRYSEILPKNKLKTLEQSCVSDRELAKKVGIPYRTVSRLRKRYGIPNPYKPTNPGYNKLFDLYIIQELTQAQVADKLDVATITVAGWLAKCGIRKRNRHEQIELAKKNGKFSNDGVMKARHTQIKNRVMKGSAPQQAVLGYLIASLEPLHKDGWEIVIGQQNWCILDGQYEIDIPVIAIRDKDIVRIAVEVDGIYWHKDKNPAIKDDRLRDKGWMPFHFTAEDKTIKQMVPDIEKFVSRIHDYIASHS